MALRSISSLAAAAFAATARSAALRSSSAASALSIASSAACSARSRLSFSRRRRARYHDHPTTMSTEQNTAPPPMAPPVTPTVTSISTVNVGGEIGLGGGDGGGSRGGGEGGGGEGGGGTGAVTMPCGMTTAFPRDSICMPFPPLSVPNQSASISATVVFAKVEATLLAAETSAMMNVISSLILAGETPIEMSSACGNRAIKAARRLVRSKLVTSPASTRV